MHCNWESRKEPLDSVGRFSIFPRIQFRNEIPEFLFITVCFTQQFNNLFLIPSGNIPQNNLATMDLTDLQGGAEGGGLSRLLNASVTIRDNQFDPGKSRSLSSSNIPDQNTSFSQLVTLVPKISR